MTVISISRFTSAKILNTQQNLSYLRTEPARYIVWKFLRMGLPICANCQTISRILQAISMSGITIKGSWRFVNLNTSKASRAFSSLSRIHCSKLSSRSALNSRSWAARWITWKSRHTPRRIFLAEPDLWLYLSYSPQWKHLQFLPIRSSNFDPRHFLNYLHQKARSIPHDLLIVGSLPNPGCLEFSHR